MKDGIHPNYRQVIFKDVSEDFSVLLGSTIETDQKGQWTDGKEYPLVKVDISSASHPFYTGKQKTMDTEGRIEKFKKKYAAKK
jgi:large subunit ribosomal protein L31